MQFKNLDANGYYRVCKAIEKRATGLTVDETVITIDRSGLKVYFMYEILRQIVVEKKHITFCMGTRPFSNICLALKGTEPWDLKEVYDLVN